MSLTESSGTRIRKQDRSTSQQSRFLKPEYRLALERIDLSGESMLCNDSGTQHEYGTVES